LKKKYKIKVWIPIESSDIDDEQIYSSLKEAEEDKKSMELMQPENIYKIQEVK
jgi:hypothetical protein